MVISPVLPADAVEIDNVSDVKELPLSVDSTGGYEYILDPSTLKTQEDIVRVLKHFSTRVTLDVFETVGIEKYVKPVTPMKTH